MSLLPVGIGGARSGGYEIEKSLRFRASASASLSRTIAASSNRKTQTISMWVKRGSIGSGQQILFGHYQSSPNNQYILRFLADDALVFANVQSGTINASRVTTRTFRDPSAWYHIVCVCDTTNATAGDRVKLYINGVQETSFSTAVNPALNTDLMINFASQPLGIGKVFPSQAPSHGDFDGYLSEINFIDGQALDPSYFGKTDPVTGQWVPKAYTGSYGANGFYLDFKDGTSLTTLGYDKSGNSNNWTLNNISLTAGVTYDWMDDTPTNNFCVLNPLASGITTAALAQANLSTTSAAAQAAIGTIGMDSGSWYWEYSFSAATTVQRVGVYGTTNHTADISATTDTIGVRFDRDTGALDYTVDGANYTNIATGLTSGTYFPYAASVTNAKIMYANFGQRPFAYTPPAGFKALCTKNLPTPQVRNGANYFDVVLDYGASIKTASEALFGNFLEWIKDRANTNNHQLIDSVRGNTAVLQSNTVADEATYSAPSGNSVGWVWRIAAGFLDVVTYTGTGVARTIAHNLGVAPAMVVVKARTTAGAFQGWAVYHQSNTAAPATDYLLLNSTAATADLDTVWNDTPPTSSELTVGTNALVNASGDDYVAFLFAEVPGFSKFGSYTGNGSADGPFVYCGFKPKFLMIKCSSTTGDWWVYDAERSPANSAVLKLLANTNGVEDVTGEDVDLLSNGFKIRSTAAGQNTNAATYVFAAFAECPFKYATAR